MKRTRFTEEQIIGVLKEAEAGGEEKQEFYRQDGGLRVHVLPMAVQVRRVNP